MMDEMTDYIGSFQGDLQDSRTIQLPHIGVTRIPNTTTTNIFKEESDTEDDSI